MASIRHPSFAEIKFDGEFNKMVVNSNGVYLVNKYGTIRDGNLGDIAIPKEHCVLYGELIYKTGKQNTLYELMKNKTNMTDLKFIAYDIGYVKYNKNMLTNDVHTLPLIERKEILGGIKGLTISKPKVIESEEELMTFYHKAITEGYEGIVSKNMDGKLLDGPIDWYKMKKKDQTDFIVSLVDPTRDRIEVRVSRPNGGVINCGVKCMPKDKAMIRSGSTVTIEYQGLTNHGSLRHPTYKGKVKT